MALIKLNTQSFGNTRINGANLPTGSIIQTQHTKIAAITTIATTTFTDVTGASVSITPLYSSSKILVTAHAFIYVTEDATNDWRGALIKILRDSTSIYQDPTSGFGTAFFLTNDNDRFMTHQEYTYLDSPATTSEITYKYQFKSKVQGESIIVNHSSYGAPGHITVQEIAQ